MDIFGTPHPSLDLVVFFWNNVNLTTLVTFDLQIKQDFADHFPQNQFIPNKMFHVAVPCLLSDTPYPSQYQNHEIF